MNPKDGLWYGAFPGTQLFGSTAAVLHFACLCRATGPLACRFSEIPRIGRCDDFGGVAPKPLVKKALRTSMTFHDALFFGLKKLQLEAGSMMEWSGPAVSFRDDREKVIAGAP